MLGDGPPEKNAKYGILHEMTALPDAEMDKIERLERDVRKEP